MLSAFFENRSLCSALTTAAEQTIPPFKPATMRATRNEVRMSTVYSANPGSPSGQSPAGQSTPGGYLKWGGIGAGILVLLATAGGCGGTPEPETITETVTTTAEATPTTVTTTARTTVTETASPEPEAAGEENATSPAGGADTRNDAAVPAQLIAPAPAPAPAPEPAPAPVEQARPQQSAYYANCSEARAAGAAPLYVNDAGYRSALDRDNDGVACE